MPTRPNFRDIVEFVQRDLGHDTWPLQEEILRAILTDRKVAVAGCHASSKTFDAAEAALFWCAKYRDGVVLCTAPGFRQVRTVLFSELHRFVRTARFKFPTVSENQTEIRFSESNYILGLTTDDASRFQGYHGRLLLIVDEAPGLSEEIWQAIEGIAAGGSVHILALGNPTVSSGTFYDCFTRNRQQWTIFKISAFRTPNFAGLRDVSELLALPDEELDNNPWPMLIAKRWVKERYASWWNGSAENSPLWQSRVLGEFPSQSQNSLFALQWLEFAQRPYEECEEDVFVGIDVAGPGSDETVATACSGGSILEMKAWNNPDPRGEVVDFLRKWQSRLRLVRVDEAGLGYNFKLHLVDQSFPVDGINVGKAAKEPERFANLKAELYWHLRARFEAKLISGLDNETLAQLSGINYSLDSAGRVKIESKDELRKRGIRSPDRAESLMLAIGPPKWNMEWIPVSAASSMFSPRRPCSSTFDISNGEPDRLYCTGEEYERWEDEQAVRTTLNYNMYRGKYKGMYG